MCETTAPPAAPPPVDHEARRAAAHAVALQLLQADISGNARRARSSFSRTIGWLLAATGFRWAWLVTSTDDTVPRHAWQSLLDPQVKPSHAGRLTNFYGTIMGVADDIAAAPLASLHAQAREVLGANTSATLTFDTASHAGFARAAHSTLAKLLAEPQHAPYARLIPQQLMLLCGVVLAYWGVYLDGNEEQRRNDAVLALQNLAERRYPVPTERSPRPQGEAVLPRDSHRVTHPPPFILPGGTFRPPDKR